MTILVVITFFIGAPPEKVEIELTSMPECVYYKHQREVFPPPPGAYMHGFYCEERDVPAHLYR